MNAVLSIIYADVPGFPAGTVVDHISVSISDTSVTPPMQVTQSVPPGSASVTFSNVAAGTYKFSVSGEDAASNTLGTPVQGSFTITAPATISLSLPASVSATQT